MEGKKASRFEVGLTNPESQRLGLPRAGNQAAVIVREHDDRTPHQRRTKHPFARNVEAVRIHQRLHRRLT